MMNRSAESSDEDDPHAGRSDVKAAIFNSINSTIGGGMLGLPFAMLQSGLIVGLILQATTF